MDNAKALINFAQYTFDGLESKAHTIIASMTNNPHFSSPVPSITDVSTAATAYTNALVAAKTGNRADISLKNQKRQALELVLKQLAAYVNYTALGNRTIIISSGFDVSKEKEQIPALEKPSDIAVANGKNSGELVVSVTAVKGAVAYVHQYTLEAVPTEQSWLSATTSTCKYVFSNLEPGKRYWCRVAAVGTKGQIIYSDPMQRIVI